MGKGSWLPGQLVHPYSSQKEGVPGDCRVGPKLHKYHRYPNSLSQVPNFPETSETAKDHVQRNRSEWRDSTSAVLCSSPALNGGQWWQWTSNYGDHWNGSWRRTFTWFCFEGSCHGLGLEKAGQGRLLWKWRGTGWHWWFWRVFIVARSLKDVSSPSFCNTFRHKMWWCGPRPCPAVPGALWAHMADAPPSINGLGASVPSGVSGPSDILLMSDDDAGEAWFQVKPWVENEFDRKEFALKHSGCKCFLKQWGLYRWYYDSNSIWISPRWIACLQRILCKVSFVQPWSSGRRTHFVGLDTQKFCDLVCRSWYIGCRHRWDGCGCSRVDCWLLVVGCECGWV